MDASKLLPVNAGELNYRITQLIDAYILSHKKDYATMNEIVGALECAKLELYRRIMAPYEDTKMHVHGDVYNPITTGVNTGE